MDQNETISRVTVGLQVVESFTTTLDYIPGSISRGTVVAIVTCCLVALLVMTYLCYDVIKRWKPTGKQDGDYEQILQSTDSSSLFCCPPFIETVRNLFQRSTLLSSKSRSRPVIPFTVPSSSGVSPESLSSRDSYRSIIPLHTAATDQYSGMVGILRTGEGGDGLDVGVGQINVTPPIRPTSLNTLPQSTNRTPVRTPSAPAGQPNLERGGATRQSLGNLDPRLYRRAEDDDDWEGEPGEDYPEGHLGRIRFSLQYNKESEKLVLNLGSARNLPRRHGGGVACDPFVKISLLPDVRSQVQSKFRKKTCNPKFDENFVFPVSRQTMDERVLKLTVYDADKLRRHNVIGHVIYPIKGHGLDIEEKVTVTRDLEREVLDSVRSDGLGELHIFLCYNPSIERLTVGIFEAKNLHKHNEYSSSADFYVKVSLVRHGSAVKTKTTNVVKKDLNPKFNESFVFKMAPDSLDTVSFMLTVWQSILGQKDKTVGRVVLGSFMFARGPELEHWNEMLANQREQIGHWHPLV